MGRESNTIPEVPTVLERTGARRGPADALLASSTAEAVARLVASSTHEFNNILTAISGRADQALNCAELPETAREALVDIRDAAERAAVIAKPLGEVARGTASRTPQSIDVARFLRTRASLWRAALGARVDLHLVLDAQSVSVRFDPAELDQILLNLLLNARDAMGGTGSVSITLSQDLTVQTTRISVRDSGPGIDPALLEQVFEPHFTTKGAGGGGSGIGLSLCRHFVEEHDGEIWVENASPSGAVFHVSLPLQAAGEAAPQLAQVPERLPRGTETVLIVEDEPLVRSVSRATLERLGYRVMEADCAATARRLVADAAGEIDLVVSDAGLPDESGWDLVAALADSYPNLGLMITSGSMPVRFTGVDFLAKPYTPRRLALAVRASLAAAQARCARR